MAEKWGVTVTAKEISEVHSTEDFNKLIATALERKTA
jgi:hypothetical protein